MPPTTMMTDNTASISLATNPQVSERNKHIEIKVHHIRDLLRRDIISLSHIATTEQLADILTKPLAREPFHYLLRRVMVHAPPHS